MGSEQRTGVRRLACFVFTVGRKTHSAHPRCMEAGKLRVEEATTGGTARTGKGWITIPVYHSWIIEPTTAPPSTGDFTDLSSLDRRALVFNLSLVRFFARLPRSAEPSQVTSAPSSSRVVSRALSYPGWIA